MVGIYKIVSPSQRVYIGQSWDLVSRLYKYQKLHCKSQAAIFHSIKKHGWTAHEATIVHELPADTDQSTLDRYEILYWELHVDAGFKMLNIREPGKGGKHAVSSRILLSKIRKNRKLSEEWRKKISNSLLGNQRTKGHKFSEERKKQISERLKGNQYTLGRSPNAKTREKMSKSQTGRTHTKETKEKMIDSANGVWSSLGAESKKSRLRGLNNPEMMKKRDANIDVKQRTDENLRRYERLFFGYEMNSGKFVGQWKNKTTCAQELGISAAGIGKVLIGKYKSSKGFYFIYQDNS